ncbi:MAG TPA: hypothetical protein P5323_03205 [Candidatus Moranbacteria bacterium]|nr:hypothetical protein [Candidatus Moranbacteria bacterium]HSA08285.1 hypothetical protein [Candidatus Moranbacteria bacterium]
MLGKKLSNILKGGAGGGILVVLLGKAWQMAKEEFIGKMGGSIVNTIINPKGREDENYFGADLLEANLTPDQRKIVQDGILLAEEYDKKNGERSAQDFRIIVTVRDKGLPTGTVRPGIKIIEDAGKKCKTKEEFFLFMQAVGAMHGSLLTKEKFFYLAETKILPFLETKGIAIAKSVANSVKNTAIAAEKKLKKRMDDHDKRGWKNYFIN